MIGPNFNDDIDCGNFFDHIDDLLDFPEDGESGFGGVNCDAFPSIWTNQSETLPGSDSVFSGNNSNSTSDLSAELSVPYEDIVQLEWLSTFVEDSFSAGSMTLDKPDPSVKTESSRNQFQTSSPVSVLESSSSSTGGKTLPRNNQEILPPSRCGRARSKRPRPAIFNPRPGIHLISPTSSITDTPQPFLSPKLETENFAESHPLVMIPKPEHKKKKKIKMTFPLGPLTMNHHNHSQDQNLSPVSQSVRKCLHCEITKTPQWRAGPMGPKTLCNACGVRYKSGRLYPEYRPAASPTFVPALHSNSHKKVLEMRNKFGEIITQAGSGGTEVPEATTTNPEFIPNNKSLLDYM